MSNRYLSSVRRIGKKVKGPARAILMVLADHANESGFCFPSWWLIQQESGLGRSTVNFHLNGLKRAGLIDWEQRFHKNGLSSNGYSLNAHRIALLDRDRDEDDSRQGRGVARDRDGGSPPRGRRSINEASSESINEASKTKETPFANAKGEVDLDMGKNNRLSKEQQLEKLVRKKGRSYPTEQEFLEFLQSEQLEKIENCRSDLWEMLESHKWHQWKEKDFQWSPIHSWQKYVKALEAKMSY
jgi:hypothetical protein